MNVDGLTLTYFTKDTAGNITATAAAKDSEGKLTAEAVTALAGIKGDAVKTATSDGSTPLTFAGLDYGYYYVESGLGTAVSVDSTKPNVTITDKNSPDPHWDDNTSTDGKLVSTDGSIVIVTGIHITIVHCSFGYSCSRFPKTKTFSLT